MLSDRSKELLRAVNADDYLIKVIEGHKLIDELLNEALAESLAYPNVLEVQRIRFPVKVDILSAPGYIPPTNRIAYHKFNSVRNEFAHNRKARFSVQVR